MAALGSVSINEGRALPFWFNIEPYREATEVLAGTQAPYTEDDKEGTRYTTATTGEKVTLLITPVYYLGEFLMSFNFSSDNPTEIDINPNGTVVFMVAPETTSSAVITVTGTSDGIAVIRTVNITLTLSGSSIIEVIEGGVAGSARKALSDPIDTALIGANPATQQNVYTSQDHVTPAYVRNTNFFLQATHAEALTCASPWNSTGGTQRAGTAVTPRHAVCAKHYSIPVGATLRFVASDNTVVERTVVQAANIIASNPLYPVSSPLENDAWLMLLDSDLPASITHCKLFPYEYETYLPDGTTTEGGAAIPLLALDYSENGIVFDYLGKDGPVIPPTPYNWWIEPTMTGRLAFNDPIIVGDSGNPIFTAIGSELWLMSTFAGSGSGPAYGGLVSELNAMITTLDTLQGDITGHTVTVGDLSSYTTY
tara:strand:+ start:1073 stop:2347 length:1275 start_codon:yes stop_codon:yes gene_type:complete